MEKCERKVKGTKLEHNSSEARIWWNRLFETIERDAAIKPERAMRILKEILPLRFLYKVIQILGFDWEEYEGSEAQPSDVDVIGEELSAMHPVDGSETAPSKLSASVESLVSSQTIPKRAVSDLLTTVGGTSAEDESRRRFKNIYRGFFGRRPDRAAVWRELPPLSWEDLSLGEKAERIAEAIAAEFVTWAKSNFKVDFTAKDVSEMFQIGAQMAAAKTLCVRLKEMPSVPNEVAEHHGLPEKGRTRMLHSEIRRDQRAARRKPRLTAFGRGLPTELLVRPQKRVASDEWMRCQNVPEKLETMQAVWEGITHLTSTRAFCQFLYDAHPDVEPPPYLVEVGLLHYDSPPSLRSSELYFF